uniref:Zn2+ transporter n=1 Tax=Lutzomyia longipalpis TaxID=7200 RepID=A0A1B0CKZ8_LUTLO
MIIISSVGVAFNVVMAIVLHGSCASVLHAHSHGSHGTHSGCDHTKNTPAEVHRHQHNGTLPNPLNLHSSSLITTHSRHNSFSKASGCNGVASGGLDEVIDLQAAEVRRGSYDAALTRLSSPHNHDYMILEQNGSLQRHNDDDEVAVRDEESSSGSKKTKNINVRAAMIHIIGDFIQSIGVLIAAIIIKIFPSAKIADPICTFIFSIIVMFTTFHIIRDAVRVLLDAVPRNMSLNRLESEIFSLDGVKSVHHLNVWSHSMDWHIMSVHLVIDNHANSEKILKSVTHLAKNFNIQHSTCQIERSTASLDAKSHNPGENGPDVTL